MRARIALLAAVLAALLSAGAFAADDADAVAGKVQKYYETVNSYKAKFRQEAVKRMINRTFANSGTVWFKKPGKMRWQYAEPDNQLIVINDTKIWFYKPKVNEVTIADARGVFGEEMPIAFLAGLGKIRETFNCSVSALGGIDTAKFAVLKLVPKKQSQISRIVLVVERATGKVVQANIIDYLENESRIFFDEVEINPRLEESQFTFTPPAGVRIVTPAAPGSPAPPSVQVAPAAPAPRPEPFTGGR